MPPSDKAQLCFFFFSPFLLSSHLTSSDANDRAEGAPNLAVGLGSVAHLLLLKRDRLMKGKGQHLLDIKLRTEYLMLASHRELSPCSPNSAFSMMKALCQDELIHVDHQCRCLGDFPFFSWLLHSGMICKRNELCSVCFPSPLIPIC